MKTAGEAEAHAPWRGADIEIWHVDLAASGPGLLALESETPRLSHWERERLAELGGAAADERRVAYIALRILIERAAGEAWRGAEFMREDGGKPYLAGATFGFSLSHAPGVALIGLLRHGAIGVDVERARVPKVGPERRALIAEAAQALNVDKALPAAGDQRFLQAWVRLEALAKSRGCGIGRLLTRLGLVGRRADSAADVVQRARVAVHEVAQTVVGDVALGDGLFAAFAAAPVGAEACVRRLPAAAGEIAALLSEGA